MTYAIHLSEAISKLKETRTIEALAEYQEALEKVFDEFDRMHEALKWYANSRNYDDDGVPCATDEAGLLDAPDRGRKAQWALRRKDLHGRVLLPTEVCEL